MRFRRARGFLCSLPDYIIIGAQKCGTSSIYQYLIQHPRIAPAQGFIDSHKEVRFFNKHFDKGPLFYRSHFPSYISKAYYLMMHRQKLITGESTPSYIFFPEIPRRVFNITPKAKLIVLLRNPVNRAYSHYKHAVRLGKETLSFENAIDREKNVLFKGDKLIIGDGYSKNFEYVYHSYLSRGLYADQLERWLKLFSEEQILVICSETFYSNPEQTHKLILDFLNLPFKKLDQYGVFNAGSYKDINPDTRMNLLKYFEPYNQRLYNLIGQKFDWDRP